MSNCLNIITWISTFLNFLDLTILEGRNSPCVWVGSTNIAIKGYCIWYKQNWSELWDPSTEGTGKFSFSYVVSILFELGVISIRITNGNMKCKHVLILTGMISYWLTTYYMQAIVKCPSQRLNRTLVLEKQVLLGLFDLLPKQSFLSSSSGLLSRQYFHISDIFDFKVNV